MTHEIPTTAIFLSNLIDGIYFSEYFFATAWARDLEFHRRILIRILILGLTPFRMNNLAGLEATLLSGTDRQKKVSHKSKSH